MNSGFIEITKEKIVEEPEGPGVFFMPGEIFKVLDYFMDSPIVKKADKTWAISADCFRYIPQEEYSEKYIHEAKTKSRFISEIDKIRMNLWVDVAVAYARAEKGANKSMPGYWADESLKAFDKTFKINNQTKEN